MITRYQIYAEWGLEQIKILKKFGLHVEQGYDSLQIDEGEVYYQLLPYLEKWKASVFYGTLYEKEELDKADILVYKGTWANGYPQPECDFGYIGSTYSKNNYCFSCGTGLWQQQPFRLIKQPKWGNKMLFDLNWIFDEIFVRKDIYKSIFKKFNIEYRDVLLYKKDTVIDDVVQLVIPISEAIINLQSHPFEMCIECNTRKYSPMIKGLFPSLENIPRQVHMFKSQEFFGSGASAHQKIFFTQELRSEIKKNKIKSQFIPVSR